MSTKGWIGVDLDGTLAEYNGWKGETHIGHPILPMLNRVRQWVADGQEVRIFTARVADESQKQAVVDAIHKWLDAKGLPRLVVTNVKDYAMIELWDDRCVQVIPNTGLRADGCQS